jgi:hypothetical protein
MSFMVGVEGELTFIIHLTRLRPHCGGKAYVKCDICVPHSCVFQGNLHLMAFNQSTAAAGFSRSVRS